MSTTERSSKILIDNHGRRIDYLRLAVTDRCNLRCQYCMPEEGIEHVPQSRILSWEEMLRLCSILVDNGVRKVRITGGEPFVRKGLLHFLEQLVQLDPKPVIGITTNGVLADRHLDKLRELGIRRLNISLDSLSADIYRRITRRNQFEQAWDSLMKAVEQGFDVKVNMVIQPGLNDREFPDFARLTRSLPVTVRFIEPMPFSGGGDGEFTPFSGFDIKKRLQESFELRPLDKQDRSVATRYRIPGHTGRIGIIFAYSRIFCSTCSRLRISAQGQVRTCLYGSNVLDLRELLRCGSSDEIINGAIREVLQHRFKDGFEAEKNRKDQAFESMSTIGG